MQRISQFPPPAALYWRVTPLILTACICEWLLGEVVAAIPHDELAVAIHAGTVFQQVFLAAIWISLGSLPLSWRLLTAWIWVSLIVLASVVPEDKAGISFWLQSSQLLLCLLVGLAGSGTVMLFGLRVRYQGEATGPAEPQQFRIRGLLGFTLLMAILLALSRTALSQFISYYEKHGLWIWPLTIAAQCLGSLILFVAALLPRYAWLAAGLALLAIAGVTAVESWLIVHATERFLQSGYAWRAVAMNSTSVLWTIAFAAVVRTSGYVVGAPQPTGSPLARTEWHVA